MWSNRPVPYISTSYSWSFILRFLQISYVGRGWDEVEAGNREKWGYFLEGGLTGEGGHIMKGECWIEKKGQQNKVLWLFRHSSITAISRLSPEEFSTVKSEKTATVSWMGQLLPPPPPHPLTHAIRVSILD